jgi:hypothetical protein
MPTPVLSPRPPSPDHVRQQARQIGRRAERTVREYGSWVVALGRFGYVAKGVVYLVVGGLAARAAWGDGGGTTDSRGALSQIVQAPLGSLALALMALGFVGYAAWRLVQALLDTERKGSDARGLLTRGTYLVVGAVYLGLALSAVRLLLGSGGGSGEDSTRDWTAWLLGQPLGPWLVGLAGLVTLGVGVSHAYIGLSARFRQQLKLEEMGGDVGRWVTLLGRVGFTARAVVFCLLGLFLLSAAWYAEPGQARGLAGALDALSQQPAGPWLLGAVALGLFAYGVFALAEARFGRMAV